MSLSTYPGLAQNMDTAQPVARKDNVSANKRTPNLSFTLPRSRYVAGASLFCICETGLQGERPTEAASLHIYHRSLLDIAPKTKPDRKTLKLPCGFTKTVGKPFSSASSTILAVFHSVL